MLPNEGVAPRLRSESFKNNSCITGISINRLPRLEEKDSYV